MYRTEGLCFFRDHISVFTADAIVHMLIVMIAIIADGLGAGLHDSSISPEKSRVVIGFCLFWLLQIHDRASRLESINEEKFGFTFWSARDGHTYFVCVRPRPEVETGTGSADVAIRMVLVPFSLALTHGEVEDSMAGMTNAIFHSSRISCGRAVQAYPRTTTADGREDCLGDFERARRTRNADVGNSPGQIGLAYAMTILFTNDGYDAFAAEIDAELGRRRSVKHRNPLTWAARVHPV